MNTRQLFEVMSKSFGLYMMFQAFLTLKDIGLAAAVGFENENFSAFLFGQVVLTLLAYLLSAWILISRSGWLANRITGPGEQVVISLSRSDILSGVIVFVGLISIVQAIPEIAAKIAHFIYFNDFLRADRQLFWDLGQRKETLLFSVIKLAAGVTLLAKHKSIVNRLEGINKQKQETA